MKISEKPVFSVSEITEYIKCRMEQDDILCNVCVCGEISNYKLHTSGHHYMTLKDTDAVINAVMFRSSASRLKFELSAGMSVIAKGRISLFPKSGQYQLYIDSIMPNGAGALQLAFEQLSRRLEAEGLFDREKKKPIPKYPERIALVTSPTGAAVRDMIKILTKRFCAAEIIVCPVTVQGDEAAKSISSMIEYINKHMLADVIIAGRGGGSIEDLWAFNEEITARAIYKSKIPVISGVGHEPDLTISDLTADVRASTPSNAAEIAVPDSLGLLSLMGKYRLAAESLIIEKIANLRERLLSLSSRKVLSSPSVILDNRKMILSFEEQRLTAAINGILHGFRHKFIQAAAKIEAMSPLTVLSRGYSIASGIDGTIIKNAADVKNGDIINLRLCKGEISCMVTSADSTKE